MIEAQKDKYFIDGFFIRHFNIWPINIDKNNLLDMQKIFIAYLIGFIPEISGWKLQLEYLKSIDEIKNLSESDIEITQEEIDISKLHGKNITKLKQKKLENEKIKRIAKLNKDYGIEEKEEDKRVTPKNNIENTPKLWELLQGKGIINGK